jgi:hypothetical protein
MLGSSWVAAQLAASQERLSSMELVSRLYSVKTGSGANPTSFPTGTGGSTITSKAQLRLVPMSRMVELILHSTNVFINSAQRELHIYLAQVIKTYKH